VKGIDFSGGSNKHEQDTTKDQPASSKKKSVSDKTSEAQGAQLNQSL